MLNLDNYRLTFEASGGSIQINYTSDNPLSNEDIAPAPAWIDAVITKEGTQEGNILITVASNDTHQRSATLKFTAYDQIDKRTVLAEIEISQLPAQETVGSIKIKSIEVDGIKVTTVDVDENRHKLKVILETSLIRSVSITNNSNWISLYSQGENEYIFNISANKDVARGASIKFEATDTLGNILNVSLNVSQSEHYKQPISFKVDDLRASNLEQVYTLNVEMKNLLNYEITAHPSWVEIQSSTATAITIKVLSNPTYKDREGKIIYSTMDVDGNYYDFQVTYFNHGQYLLVNILHGKTYSFLFQGQAMMRATLLIQCQ